MEDEIQYLRDEESVMDESLFPGGGLSPEVEDRRSAAIVEVLRRLPDAAYADLLERAETFSWFLPPEGMLAGVWPFPITHREETPSGLSWEEARVIYMSATLETASWELLVGIVVHELTHIYLKHNLRTDPGDYDRQETEVFEQVRAWGFEREAKRHLQSNRARKGWVARRYRQVFGEAPSE
jgi:hypothetical protein